MPRFAPVERWQFQADGPLNSSPAVAAGTVFQGSAAGILVALDLGSGARLWSSRLSGPLTTPTVVGHLVVVGSGSGVAIALDRDSGALSWKAELGGEILGAPAAAEAGLALASTSGVVVLVDPTDGRTVWRTKLDGRIARSPAIGAGVIVVPLEPGELAALDVASGDLLWRTTIASGGGVGTPAIDGGRVVTAAGLDESNASDRAIVALDLRSGALDWRWTSSTGSTVYSPALDGGRGYVVSEGGFAVALDVRTGMELWRSDLGAPAEALAAVAAGSVLVASNRHDLVSLDAETGAAEWHVPITGVPYAPVVSCGWVLVPSNLGTLTVFGAPS